MADQRFMPPPPESHQGPAPASFAPPPPVEDKVDTPIGDQPFTPDAKGLVGLARTGFGQATEGLKGIAKTAGRDAYGMLTSPMAGPLGIMAGYAGKKLGITPKVEAATETNPNSPAQTTGKYLTRVGEFLLPGPETASGLLPNAGRAGRGLEAIEQQIGHLPVNLSKASVPALRAQEYGNAGAYVPGVVNKVLEKIPQNNPLPTTFREVRRLASVAGDLSASDRMAMGGPVPGAVKELAKALSEGNLETATNAGVGTQYQKYIDEYRRAMKLGGAKENAVELAKKFAARALQGAGLGAGYEAFHALKGD